MMRSAIAASLCAALLLSACTAAAPAVQPGVVSDGPLRLSITPPLGDGRVRLSVVVQVADATQFRFFQRTGLSDTELPVTPAGEREFIWEAKGLGAGVYTLWASAYSNGGRLLGSSPLTPLVLTPATATTLPPLRGAVRDAT